jgi:hypothetical protein
MEDIKMEITFNRMENGKEYEYVPSWVEGYGFEKAVLKRNDNRLECEFISSEGTQSIEFPVQKFIEPLKQYVDIDFSDYENSTLSDLVALCVEVYDLYMSNTLPEEIEDEIF